MASLWQRITGNTGDIAEDRNTNAQAAAAMQDAYITIAAGLSRFGGTPAGQAAIAQGGATTGAAMAGAMRERYFKKEFELVRQTKVQPILQTMQDDLDAYRARMAISTRPIQRTVNAVKGQELGETIAANNPQMEQVPTGKNDINGKPVLENITQPAQPAFNPAFVAPGQIGAVETYDGLSIVDPATGLPVDLDDPRAYALKSKFTDDYWRSYGDNTTRLLDLFGEYQGNPFADSAAKAIIAHTTQIAGQAATAEADPDKQRDMMLHRQKLQADIETQRQTAAEEELKILGGRGEMQAGTRMAGQLPPEFGGLFENENPDVLAGKQPGTPQEQARLSAIYEKVFAREKIAAAMAGQTSKNKFAAQKQYPDLFPIPDQIASKPDQWARHLITMDKPTKGLYTQRVTELAATMESRLANMSNEERAAKYESVQAPPDVVRAVQFNSPAAFQDPAVKTFTAALVLAEPGAREDAEGYAIQQRLDDAARLQPDTVAPMMDQVVDRYINEQRARGADISSAQEALIRADGPRVVAEYTLGHPLQAHRSPGAEARYQDAVTQVRKQNALDAAATGFQTRAFGENVFDQDVERLARLAPDENNPISPLGTGSAAPITGEWLPLSPGSTPAPGQPIGVSPTNAEAPSQPERPTFLGMDVDPNAPLPRMMNRLEEMATVTRPEQAPTTPTVAGTGLPFGYKPPNPYLGMDQSLLMNLLITLPQINAPASINARNQIKEALEVSQQKAAAGSK